MDATFLPLTNVSLVSREITILCRKILRISPNRRIVDFPNSRLPSTWVVKKLKLKEVPLSGVDNYNYLKRVWEQEKLTTSQDFDKWYSNKDVVPTTEAMQKMMAFYRKKTTDMLKLGCTLPNLASNCLHNSINNKICPFIEADKDLYNKPREDLVPLLSLLGKRLWSKHKFESRKKMQNNCR